MARVGAHIVVPLFLLLGLSFVQASLVAYYDFDVSSSLAGKSGYCQNSVPTGATQNSATLISNVGMFGTGVISLNGTTDSVSFDGLSLFPGATSTAFSVSAWVKFFNLGTGYQYRNIVRKNSFITFQLNSLTGNNQKTYGLYCVLWFSASVSSTVYTSKAFTQNTMGYWTHVACVYNTTHLCAAINGTISSCTSAAASQISPTSGTIYAGYTANSLVGFMDELKFYDHALTAGQLNELYQGQAANDVPKASVSTNGLISGSVSAAALTSLNVSANGTDTRLAYSGAPGEVLYFSWSILSSTCEIASLSNSSADQPSLALNNVGTLVLTVCVTDGELSSSAQAQVLVTASDPIISGQTDGPTLSVPLGYVNFPVSVTATGVPAPTYQWQYLALENVTIPDNSTGNGTVAKRSAFAFDDSEPEYEVRWLDSRALIEVWENIPGANSNVYLINGTMENNNQSIRCLVTNSGGSVTTDPYVIDIVAAASPSANPSSNPSGGTSGSDTNVAAIVGGAVGGGVGLLCLLLVLMALVLLVLMRKRSGHKMRKLVQPDYAQLAYGDADNVSLSKRNAEQYEKLEKVLLADDGRVTLAMLRSVGITESEKVAKALMRVFEANNKGYRLLEQRISEEVDLADEEGTLFRANSVAAKMFSAYVRMTSLPYIWFTLVTSVNTLNDNAVEAFGEDTGDGASRSSLKKMRYKIDDDASESIGMDMFNSSPSTMEIDPHKMDDASDTTINSLELWLAAQKMFKCIVDSERIMPMQIKQLMHHIHSEVGSRFSSEAQFRALGGFLFLRMISPALMAPQVYGLLDSPPHPVAQRQLILVAKVLQNLANDTLPGAKEAYMEQLNSFIATNKGGLDKFYQRVLNGTDRGKAAESEVPLKAKQGSLAVLHRYLSGHLQVVEKAMAEDESGDSELVEELKRVVAQLGDDDNV